MFGSDIFRTTTFRLTLGLVAVIIIGIGVQFAALYVQMDAYEKERSSDYLYHSAEMLAAENPHELEVKLKERSTNELRVFLNGAALFTLEHKRISGDIMTWPEGLLTSPKIQPLKRVLPDGTVSDVRFLVVEVLGPKGAPDRLLVLERSRRMASDLHDIAQRAAVISLFPLVVFALIAGMILSRRALRRIKNMRYAIERIMKGDLHERLPVGRGHDDVERLVSSVNHMLERLEQLVGEIRNVGNDIAHDLRTPLARVQARLERVGIFSEKMTRENSDAFDNVMGMMRRDLEQCFSVITALLRIGEIENGQRRAGFAEISLMPVIEDMVDLYEPIAEENGIDLYKIIHLGDEKIYGDRALLNEVLANLLDNALKFTKSGGSVSVRLMREHEKLCLEVRDTGVGIAENEREAVLGRFYRADKSRNIPGSGLGLSLVVAILRLHEAELKIMHNDSDATSSGTIFRIYFKIFE